MDSFHDQQVADVSVGVEIIDPMAYLKVLVPSKGILTEHEPSENESDDVKYGLAIVRELAKFDIGQTIAVIHYPHF